jgi:hypothetical protein
MAWRAAQPHPLAADTEHGCAVLVGGSLKTIPTGFRPAGHNRGGYTLKAGLNAGRRGRVNASALGRVARLAEIAIKQQGK